MISGARALYGLKAMPPMLKLSITTERKKMKTVTNGMRPIHPGEVLREEFIRPLGMTAHALSMALQVPAPRIHEILHERRSMTVDTALRLAKYFGTSAEFWLGLQNDYDMAIPRSTMGEALARIGRCELTSA